MLVKNSLIYALSIALKGGLGFLLIGVYTRLLSPTEYGDYAVVIALVTFMDALAFLWIRHAIMRHITHEAAKSDASYLTNASLIYGAVAMLVLLISGALFMLGFLGGSGHGAVFELIGLLVITEGLSNLFILIARIRLRHGVFMALNVIKPLLALALGVILIKMGWSVSGALLALLISSIFVVLIGAWKSRLFQSFRPALTSRAMMRDIAAFGLPLVIVLSVQSGIAATDRLLLETLIGGQITGLYAAAQDIPARLLNMVALSIHMAAYPLAVQKLKNHGQKACRAQLSINLTLLIGVLIPASLGIALLSTGLSTLFLGEVFRPFANIYMPYFTALSLLNCGVQYYIALSFNLAKKTRLLILPFTLALFANLLVGAVLIPKIGAAGALLGSAASYIFLFLSLSLMSRRIFPLPVPWKNLAQIILASALMSAVICMISDRAALVGFFAAVALGGLVYVGALLAMNTMNLRNEILKHIKKAP